MHVTWLLSDVNAIANTLHMDKLSLLFIVVVFLF